MGQSLRCILCAAAALFVQTAAAQYSAPDELVRSVTDEVVGVIKRDKDIQAGNRQKTIALVEQKVVPHFDFTRMTALATGINWRKATPEQQQSLVAQFRTLLVRTYSTTLSAYRDQVIDVKPPLAPPSDTEVVVRSELRQSGAEPLSIDYSLAKTSAGWKVYDVVVGGVSLVTTYRDIFAAEVRNGGINGLILSISAKNRQLASKRD